MIFRFQIVSAVQAPSAVTVSVSSLWVMGRKSVSLK